MAILAHGFYLPPPTRTPKSSNRKLVGYSSSIIVRRRLLTDGNECVQVSELFTPKTFRIRSFSEEDAGHNEVEISKDILVGEDGISDELLGNVMNAEISTESSFLAKIAIALGVAATVTLISVGIKGAPAIGSSNGIQIFPDSSSSSVMAAANVGFTIKAFGYSIVLPAFAPGWIYFWLLMAAGCGLFISEEALNIWVCPLFWLAYLWLRCCLWMGHVSRSLNLFREMLHISYPQFFGCIGNVKTVFSAGYPVTKATP